MKSTQSGKVRIIAGLWRGRLLSVAEHQQLRPTPNRVRETLFNWLQVTLPGADCLDLFAGSGALAFEALSRGAAAAVAVEHDKRLLRVLAENQAMLKADALQIVQQDAFDCLSHCDRRFDIIFLDPPFHQGLLDKALALIQQRELLNNNGLIYMESEAGLSLASDVIVHKQKLSGQVQYGLYSLS